VLCFSYLLNSGFWCCVFLTYYTQGSGVVFFLLTLQINSNKVGRSMSNCVMGWNRFQRDCSDDTVVYIDNCKACSEAFSGLQLFATKWW